MSRFSLILAAALVAVPVAALGQQTVTTVIANRDRAVVSYADLNLASAQGQRTLKRRLSGAIEEVCGSFANVTEYSEEIHVTRCRAAAWKSADRQLSARPTDQKLALVLGR